MGRYYTDTYSDKEFLSHHGILGQKWGVRRYQNEDGTLTEEGRKHYGVGDRVADVFADARNKSRQKKINKKRAKALEKARTAQKKKAEEKKKREADLKKYNLSDKATETVKNLDKMSDKEVADALNRLRNEKSIRDMASDETKAWNAAHPSDIQKAMKVINTASDVVTKVEPGIRSAINIANALGLTNANKKSDNSPKDKNSDEMNKLKDIESDLNLRKKKLDLAEKKQAIDKQELDLKNKQKNSNPANQNSTASYIIGETGDYNLNQIYDYNSENMDVISPLFKSWGLE